MLKIIKDNIDSNHTCDLSCKFLYKNGTNVFSCNKINVSLQKFNEDTPHSLENCGGNINIIK